MLFDLSIAKQITELLCLMFSISIDIILFSGDYSVANKENTEKAVRVMALVTTIIIMLRVIVWIT